MKSYPVLVLACAVIAILLSSCSTPQIVTRQQAEIDSLDVAIQSLRDSLAFLDSIDSGSYYRDLRLRDARAAELEYMLSVCRDGGTTVAVELVDNLFQPASADLLESGKVLLDTIAVRLPAVEDINVLRIQAHADNIPPGATIKDRFPSNWELSAARASAIARYYAETLELPEKQIEAVSLGDAHPLFDNTTPQGRRRNRRIEFTIL